VFAWKLEEEWYQAREKLAKNTI